MSPLLDAARARVGRLTLEVDRLRERERREIRNAVTTHGPVGNGYWEERHQAELKLRAAVALVDALDMPAELSKNEARTK